jgi:hypothetical protein
VKQIILRILFVVLLLVFTLIWEKLTCTLFMLFFACLFLAIFYEVFTYISALKHTLLDGIFGSDSKIKKILNGKLLLYIKAFIVSFTLSLIVLLGLSAIDNILFILTFLGISLFVILLKIFKKVVQNELNYGYWYAKKWVFLLFSLIMVFIYGTLFGLTFEPILTNNSFFEHIRTISHNPEVNCIIYKDLHVGTLYLNDMKIWLYSSFLSENISIFSKVFVTIFLCFSLFSYFFAIAHLYSFILHINTKEIPEKLKPGLFVLTLFALAILSATLFFSGFLKKQDHFFKTKTSHTEEVFRLVLGSDFIEVPKNEIPQILQNIHLNKENILDNSKTSIDTLVDEAFDIATPKITKAMSEWYFSILTDYALLLHWATKGSVDDMVVEKFNEIFSKNFPNDIDEKFLYIKNEFEKNFSISTINVMKKYDMNINIQNNNDILYNALSNSFKELSSNSFKKLSFSAGISATSLGVLGVLSAKGSLKLAGKIAAKTATKGGASLAAGTSGLSCGPFAVICSPLLAIGTWVGVDYAITKLDESFNREEFESDIVQSLDVGRENLKRDMFEALENYYSEIEKNLTEKMLK